MESQEKRRLNCDISSNNKIPEFTMHNEKLDLFHPTTESARSATMMSKYYNTTLDTMDKSNKVKEQQERQRKASLQKIWEKAGIDSPYKRITTPLRVKSQMEDELPSTLQPLKMGPLEKKELSYARKLAKQAKKQLQELKSARP